MGNRVFRETKTTLILISNFIYDSPIKHFLKSNLEFRMSHLTETEVQQLKQRLQKAEKRMLLLQNEILDIKKTLYGTSADLKLSSKTIQKRHLSTTDTKTDCEIDGFEYPTSKRLCSDSTSDYVVVYTDGACESNGKFGAKAGIGVWFGDNSQLNISKPVEGRATNNTAEIQACINAVKTAHNNGIRKLQIRTDSQFVINSMTQWIHKWKKNNWKLSTGGDVKNKVDFMELDRVIGLLDDVKWEHVAGHKGIRGNEEADRLARAGAALYKAK